MSSLWAETTLGDFAPFSYGKGLPARDRRPGRFPVLGSGGRVGVHEKRLVAGPCIVVGRKGTVGALYWEPDGCWPIDTTFFIADDPARRDLRFTYYLLKTLRLEGMNQDSAVPGLNRDHAHSLRIMIPDLAEQQSIGAVLGAFDELIDMNLELAVQLEDLLHAEFAKHAFDLPGRHRLDEFVQVNPPRAKPRGIAPYVDMAALSESTSRVERVMRRPAAGGVRFKNGDVLMARITPCLENGKAGFVDCLDEDAIAVGSTEFIVMSANSPVPAYWPYLLSRSARFREHAIRHMTGTSGRQRCPADAVASYPIAEPRQGSLTALAQVADPLFGSIRELHEEVDQLVSARDALLPVLVSGRLRVWSAQ